ncbi:tetratricopeptide repeat protein [Aliikangiella sp. G2MR2-5]|uniref:tetratricopeptide repeat protein n=1 Tax=Aliikangiella sp. G2MR2-5 TaxID=2788943 RepID=UPI0018A9A68D|nr:tetratricopeptide repeat protein [Aliikangiella sp. G2MR2-5]
MRNNNMIKRRTWLRNIFFPPLIATMLTTNINATEQSIEQTINVDISPLTQLPVLQKKNLESAVVEQIESQNKKINQQLVEFMQNKTKLAQQYELMGQLYHAYELYEPAKISYQNALQLEPGRFTSQYLLALVFRSSEMPNEAVESFVQAQRINAAYPALWINLGETLEQLSRYDKSKIAFQKAQELTPNEPSIFAGIGKLLLSEKKYKQSIQFFEQALKLVPQADRLHYSIAMAYRGLGDEIKAREHLKLSGKIGIKPHDPIRENLEQLLAGERVQLLQGKNEFAMGKYQESINSFQEALAAAPDSVRARINLSAALTKLNKIADAQEHLEKAIELAPENATAHFNLAKLLQHQKKYSGALKHFESAAKISPTDAGILFELANIQQYTGKIDEALRNFEKINKISPENTVAQAGYANLLFHKKQYQKAIEILEQVNKAHPTDGLIAHDLARALVTVPQQGLRDGTKALQLAKVVMSAQPTLEHADTLIRAYVETGSCQNASTLVEQVLNSIDPSDPKLPKLKQNYERLLRNMPGGKACN